MNERRVAYLEDPAQLDPAKQAGIDGLRDDQTRHQCQQIATRITDSGAFAVAFARGLEQPQVSAALNSPLDADDKPSPVQLPIERLLGSDGHRHCTGWQIEPVDGSMRAARKFREAWITAPAETRTEDIREPTARPVETFEGGTVVFVFGHNRDGDGYEVRTMYPRPPQDESYGDAMTGFYWERHPGGPFATLIGVAATYCSPNADAEDYERLKRLARRADDERMRAFKDELRQALTDPSQLPKNELDDAVEYDDGTDEKFLRRLWRDLYGDEPVTGP